MKTTRLITAALFVAAIAAGGFAALSETNSQFGNGPAKHLMTREEAAAWKNIKDDAEAQTFISAFWARRDPTPTTPANEFHAEFDGRVKYADEHFTEGRTKGSLTDRGRVFVVMGSPAVVRRTTKPTNAMGAPEPPSGGIGIPQPPAEANVRNMIWVYDQAKTQLPLPAPTVNVLFIDQYGNDVWRLDRAPGVDVNAMLQRAAAAEITNPNATGAPAAQASSPQTAPATPAVATTVPAPAQVGTFKTDSLKAAVDLMRAAKESPYKDMTVSYGEFITPTGQYYVPVQLALPASAGQNAESNLTFFGEVDDAAGTAVAIFEEPAKLLASKGDFVFDKTLKLSPGTYRGTFGLADKTGKPVSMVSTTMTLKGLDKSAPSISDLILSNDIYPLSTAQAPTDPFAFGGMKVVPKSDRTFTTADELWYFFELRNPGIDTGTNLPKIQMKLSLTGKTTAGKDVRMENPLSDTAAIEIKGVPGHFGVGQSLALQTFKAGNYVLKIKIVDLISKQTYNLEQPFKIVG